MANLSTLPGIVDFIRNKVESERKSYETVSDELRLLNPSMRGLSARSIRRFCSEHNVHSSSRLTDVQIDRVVAESVSQV